MCIYVFVEMKEKRDYNSRWVTKDGGKNGKRSLRRTKQGSGISGRYTRTSWSGCAVEIFPLRGPPSGPIVYAPGREGLLDWGKWVAMTGWGKWIVMKG